MSSPLYLLPSSHRSQHPTSLLSQQNGLRAWFDPPYFSFQSFKHCPEQPKSQLVTPRPGYESVSSWWETHPHFHPTYTSTTTDQLEQLQTWWRTIITVGAIYNRRVPNLLTCHHCAADLRSCLSKYLGIFRGQCHLYQTRKYRKFDYKIIQFFKLSFIKFDFKIIHCDLTVICFKEASFGKELMMGLCDVLTTPKLIIFL